MGTFDSRMVMSEDDKKYVGKLEELIGRYEMGYNLDLNKLDPQIYESLNISADDMYNLTANEVLHHAYVIMGHISKLTTELNRHKAILFNISAAYSDGLNHYLANKTFPEYTKYETKEQIICKEDTMIYQLRELKRKIETVVILFEDKFEPLRRTVDLLNNIARNKT